MPFDLDRKAMKAKWIKKLVLDLPGEERKLASFKEIPCKDMDLDCFALDGKIPFGSYKRCYEYAPELGKCIFYEWEKEKAS
jgi:hypothetical protein